MFIKNHHLVWVIFLCVFGLSISGCVTIVRCDGYPPPRQGEFRAAVGEPPRSWEAWEGDGESLAAFVNGPALYEGVLVSKPVSGRPSFPKNKRGGETKKNQISTLPANKIGQELYDNVEMAASGAAAKMLLASRCDSSHLSELSTRVPKKLVEAIAEMAPSSREAQRVGEALFKNKYKALRNAHPGAECSELGRLRMLAGSQGFLP